MRKLTSLLKVAWLTLVHGLQFPHKDFGSGWVSLSPNPICYGGEVSVESSFFGVQPGFGSPSHPVSSSSDLIFFASRNSGKKHGFEERLPLLGR